MLLDLPGQTQDFECSCKEPPLRPVPESELQDFVISPY